MTRHNFFQYSRNDNVILIPLAPCDVVWLFFCHLLMSIGSGAVCIVTTGQGLSGPGKTHRVTALPLQCPGTGEGRPTSWGNSLCPSSLGLKAVCRAAYYRSRPIVLFDCNNEFPILHEMLGKVLMISKDLKELIS